MLQGWFFIQGNVGAWLAEMLKGKHAHVLDGIDIDPSLKGKAIAWCPEPTNEEKLPLYAPPIDQGIHVPYHAKKPVQGLFVTTTVNFLTQKLGAPVLVSESRASGSGDTVEANQADQEALEQQDKEEEEEEEEVQERPSRRRRTDWNVYEPVDIDGQLFPDGKYRGKYADQCEGDL
jgi:hypothetical protein